ncbi:hypothetical protein C0995_011471 [Termitomyces sp. Mi166|nr:hypothetical protein C0995_011471 [Termitomyces sp. Mi166\
MSSGRTNQHSAWYDRDNRTRTSSQRYTDADDRMYYAQAGKEADMSGGVDMPDSNQLNLDTTAIPCPKEILNAGIARDLDETVEILNVRITQKLDNVTLLIRELCKMRAYRLAKQQGEDLRDDHDYPGAGVHLHAINQKRNSHSHSSARSGSKDIEKVLESEYNELKRVRIQRFPTLYELRENRGKNAHKHGEVTLDVDGNLDLGKVRETFDIDTCLPVHPVKWNVFKSAESDKLYELAVHALSELGPISFVSG